MTIERDGDDYDILQYGTLSYILYEDWLPALSYQLNSSFFWQTSDEDSYTYTEKIKVKYQLYGDDADDIYRNGYINIQVINDLPKITLIDNANTLQIVYGKDGANDDNPISLRVDGSKNLIYGVKSGDKYLFTENGASDPSFEIDENNKFNILNDNYKDKTHSFRVLIHDGTNDESYVDFSIDPNILYSTSNLLHTSLSMSKIKSMKLANIIDCDDQQQELNANKATNLDNSINDSTQDEYYVLSNFLSESVDDDTSSYDIYTKDDILDITDQNLNGILETNIQNDNINNSYDQSIYSDILDAIANDTIDLADNMSEMQDDDLVLNDTILSLTNFEVLDKSIVQDTTNNNDSSENNNSTGIDANDISNQYLLNNDINNSNDNEISNSIYLIQESLV